MDHRQWRSSHAEIYIVYCVLNSIKVNVGRNVRCAVHAAQWV